jgi:hypothetical protein
MSAAVEDEPELINSRNVTAADTERDAGDAQESNSNGLKGKQVEMGTKDEEEKPRPSKLKRIWAKLDLDLGTLMMMFK